MPYISLWHIQRGPGTVKTVPYSLFYIAMQTYKWSVGRNALIPPRRSLADCSNANLSGHSFACAKTFCHSNTPQGCLLLAQTRTCRGAAPPSCYRKTVLSLESPTGAFIASLRFANANLSEPCCISHYGIYSEAPERSRPFPTAYFILRCKHTNGL